MPLITNSVVAVDSGGVKLADASNARRRVLIQQDGTADVALGGPGVTFATGYKIGATGTQTDPPTYRELRLHECAAEVWAIADAGQTGSVRVWVED